jgi:S-adenosylmethionine uptake transporter
LQNRSPAFWILLASLLFATMSALVKVAATGVSLQGIVFFRTLPSSVGLFAFARARGLPIASRNWKLHLLRSLAGVGGMFVAFYAVSKLPLATATTLEYTTPLFMLAYMVVFARRHLTPQMLLAMIGGFAGVLVLLRPSFQTGQTLAFLAGLASGALAALAFVQIRRLGEAEEPVWRIVMFNSWTGTLIAAAMIPFAPPSNYSVTTLIALGAVGIVGMFAQLAMTRAFSKGSTTLLASLQYSTVAFSATYGIVIWGDTPSAATALGLALIVMSCVIALRRGGKPIIVES